jgi:hypothetical protein
VKGPIIMTTSIEKLTATIANYLSREGLGLDPSTPCVVAARGVLALRSEPMAAAMLEELARNPPKSANVRAGVQRELVAEATSKPPTESLIVEARFAPRSQNEIGGGGPVAAHRFGYALTPVDVCTLIVPLMFGERAGEISSAAHQAARQVANATFPPERGGVTTIMQGLRQAASARLLSATPAMIGGVAMGRVG